MKAVDIAKRLRSHVNLRGGPAKGENGKDMGTVWPMMLEAADELERLEAEVARLKDENGVLMEKMTNMLDMMVR